MIWFAVTAGLTGSLSNTVLASAECNWRGAHFPANSKAGLAWLFTAQWLERVLTRSQLLKGITCRYYVVWLRHCLSANRTLSAQPHHCFLNGNNEVGPRL